MSDQTQSETKENRIIINNLFSKKQNQLSDLKANINNFNSDLEENSSIKTIIKGYENYVNYLEKLLDYRIKLESDAIDIQENVFNFINNLADNLNKPDYKLALVNDKNGKKYLININKEILSNLDFDDKKYTMLNQIVKETLENYRTYIDNKSIKTAGSVEIPHLINSKKLKAFTKSKEFKNNTEKEKHILEFQEQLRNIKTSYENLLSPEIIQQIHDVYKALKKLIDDINLFIGELKKTIKNNIELNKNQKISSDSDVTKLVKLLDIGQLQIDNDTYGNLIGVLKNKITTKQLEFNSTKKTIRFNKSSAPKVQGQTTAQTQGQGNAKAKTQQLTNAAKGPNPNPQGPDQQTKNTPKPQQAKPQGNAQGQGNAKAKTQQLTNAAKDQQQAKNAEVQGKAQGPNPTGNANTNNNPKPQGNAQGQGNAKAKTQQLTNAAKGQDNDGKKFLKNILDFILDSNEKLDQKTDNKNKLLVQILSGILNNIDNTEYNKSDITKEIVRNLLGINDDSNIVDKNYVQKLLEKPDLKTLHDICQNKAEEIGRKPNIAMHTCINLFKRKIKDYLIQYAKIDKSKDGTVSFDELFYHTRIEGKILEKSDNDRKIYINKQIDDIFDKFDIQDKKEEFRRLYGQLYGYDAKIKDRSTIRNLKVLEKQMESIHSGNFITYLTSKVIEEIEEEIGKKIKKGGNYKKDVKKSKTNKKVKSKKDVKKTKTKKVSYKSKVNQSGGFVRGGVLFPESFYESNIVQK